MPRPDIKNENAVERSFCREVGEIHSTGQSYRSAGIFEFTIAVDHVVVTRLRNGAGDVSEISGPMCSGLYSGEALCDDSSPMEKEECCPLTRMARF